MNQIISNILFINCSNPKNNYTIHFNKRLSYNGYSKQSKKNKTTKKQL